MLGVLVECMLALCQQRRIVGHGMNEPISNLIPLKQPDRIPWGTNSVREVSHFSQSFRPLTLARAPDNMRPE